MLLKINFNYRYSNSPWQNAHLLKGQNKPELGESAVGKERNRKGGNREDYLDDGMRRG